MRPSVLGHLPYVLAIAPALLLPVTSSCARGAAPPAEAAAGSGPGSPTTGPSLSNCKGPASSEAPPLADCGLHAKGDAPLIDDFSDKNLELSELESRNGSWFVYTDETDGCVEASLDTKEGALSVEGDGFSKWGAGFGFLFSFEAGRACMYDASAYAGVRFRMRGNAQVRVVLPTKESTFATQGGQCPDSEGCYDRHGVSFGLSEKWQTYEVPFCAVTQEGWGTSSDGFDPDEVTGVNFHVRSTKPFQVWIDDIEFIPKADTDGTTCQAVCPLEQLPQGLVYDPKTTPQTGGISGFSLHTFEQTTPDCGPLVRRYLVHKPSSAGTDPPVVLILPGTSADAESLHDFQTSRRFAELSDRDGFVLVYANAAPGPHTVSERPNGGRFWLSSKDNPQVDDREYLDLIVRDLIDRKIIGTESPRFLAGHSIGGGLALEAALGAPERYRGIAAVMPFDNIPPSEPPATGTLTLERLLIAYTYDDPGLPTGYHEELATIPAAYASSLGIAADDPKRTLIDDSVQEGRDYMGTNAVALRTRDSHATRIDFSGSGTTRAVRAIEFDHAGHFWPTANPFEDESLVAEYGFRNRDLDMSEEIWSFFKGSL